MNALLVFGVLVMSFLSVRAQEVPVYDGYRPEAPLELSVVASQVRPGSIIVMGESHGLKSAQQAQMELMRALRSQGLKVSVGLEFFYYPDQPLVDLYRQGQVSEADFLQEIRWGSPSYDFYREQALFPLAGEGARTLALNAPRSLTSRIAKAGLESLTAEERQLLPPGFELGRATYKERFLALMPHLPTPEAGERYFAAQSVWDDTMAWKAAEFMQNHPDQVLLIVVGDFHAAYGGGLPDRLTARTGKKPLVFSFVNVKDLGPEESAKELMPSPLYGVRADYLWVAQE